MFTLIVILINIGILFNNLLFEGNIIYWSGFVQTRDLVYKYVEMDAFIGILKNVIPLGVKGIPLFLACGEQVALLLPWNYLTVKGNERPLEERLMGTSPAKVEHHLFFQIPKQERAPLTML